MERIFLKFAPLFSAFTAARFSVSKICLAGLGFFGSSGAADACLVRLVVVAAVLVLARLDMAV